jgi:hypothetical protein
MRHALVVFALLLYPNTLLAQQSVRFGASDKAAIGELFDRYNQAASTKDYPTLREQLQAPFLRFPAGVEVLPTLDDVMNFYRMLRESFDAQYARSQLVESRITALAADRALVNGRYRRYRKDGTVLLEASAIYLVSKSSGAWKICGVFAQDLDAFGKVY